MLKKMMKLYIKGGNNYLETIIILANVWCPILVEAINKKNIEVFKIIINKKMIRLLEK